jgi:hypothetical protein
MGNLLQAEVVAEFAEIDQHLDEPAVVGLEEGLGRQQSEELVLGEVLPRELRAYAGMASRASRNAS